MRFKRLLLMSVTLLTLALLGPVGTAFALPDTMSVVTPTSLLAPIAKPTGVAVDGKGNIFIADTRNNRVLMFNSSYAPVLTKNSGVIGSATGVAGFKPTNANGTTINSIATDYNILLNSPAGVAVDASGNLYIADSANNRVHMVRVDTTTGAISDSSVIVTIAGNGLAGFSGDGASSISASLNNPTGVAVDASGNILIADNGNNRIRKVLAPKFAANGTPTYGNISTIAGDGKPSTLTAFSIALSPAPAGDLYIADSGNNRILKMTGATGAPVSFAGTGTAGDAGSGGLALQAQLNQPSGVATDGKYLYVADTMNNCIRMISLATGVMTTRTGTAGAPEYALISTLPLTRPMGVAVSASGDLFIADTMSAAASDVIKQVTASVSATTTANPPGGSYTTTQRVALTASKAATITYSLTNTPPGGVPSTTGGTYTQQLTIPTGTTVLTFYSTDFAGNTELTNSAVYAIDTEVPVTTATIYAAPTVAATPINGVIYSSRSDLSVSLLTFLNAASLQSFLTTSSLAGQDTNAAIYYTTSGVIPTAAAANAYAGSFTIPVTAAQTTTNVQFFAVDLAGNKEVVKSQKFTVVALAATASPTGGTYRSAQIVTIASNLPTGYGYIYYTTDGSDPTGINETPGTALVTLSGPATLKFYASTGIGSAGERTPVQTLYYNIDTIAPTAMASPVGSVKLPFKTPQTVTLTSNDPGAAIYYTTTGIAPTTASARYTAPITVSANTTLMYFAMDTASNRGTIMTDVYVIDTVAPVTTASLLSGTYASVQSVKLTSNDATATIYYTTDGTQPTTASARYSSPLAISKTTTLRYFAMDLAGNPEAVQSQTYEIITLTSTAAPKGGVFNAVQTVELTTNGVGAKIYYTLNPITPTPQYTEYTTPILISNTSTTLMYYAVDGAGVTESVKTDIYTMDTLVPSTASACGTTADTIKLTAADNVTLLPRVKFLINTTGATMGTAAVAPYTLTDYTGPITIAANTIVKFFATDEAGNTEKIKTAFCPMVTAPDPVPSLYLTTLNAPYSTSETDLFLNGNVGPFAGTSLTVNGTAVATNSADGSFSYQLPAATGTVTTTVTGIAPYMTPNTDARTIVPGPSPTSVTIGAANGVVGHVVRVPITFTSNYQAGAAGIDIYAYDVDPTVPFDPATTPFTSRLADPSVEITGEAAATGKTISGGFVQTASAMDRVYRIFISDPLSATGTIQPIPDGVVAYLKFTVLNPVTAGKVTLLNTANEVTDLNGNPMSGIAFSPDGVVNVVSQPGNCISTAPLACSNSSVSLGGVLSAVHMLLNPNLPVDGAVDLNADGKVQINEVQQVANAYVGL